MSSLQNAYFFLGPFFLDIGLVPTGKIVSVLLINPSLGKYQEIPPSRPIGINSVEMEFSMAIMTKWKFKFVFY